MAIALGAILGALSRYFLSAWVAQWGSQWAGPDLPLSTLLVNLTGCFGMGLLATLFGQRVLGHAPELQLMLTTGFLGSYTTFSSYELDLAGLADRRNLLADGLYWGASTLLGFGSLLLGVWVARAIAPPVTLD
ncbi:MAG: fluoride efflux transporter CrcB [Cyanobacteria bacterium J069]